MEKYYVGIVGGKNYNNSAEMMNVLFYEINNRKESLGNKALVIVCDGEYGAGALALYLANKYELQQEVYRVEWNNLNVENCNIKVNTFGKKYNALAGFNSSKSIVEKSDIVLAFYDGKDVSVSNAIALCMDKGVECITTRY